MENDKSLNCSGCNTSQSLELRYGACVSYTIYVKNNQPQNNENVTSFDDFRIWQIPLCKDCLKKNYRLFLKVSLKKFLPAFFICIGALTIGVLVIVFDLRAGSNTFLAIAHIVLLFGGALGSLFFGYYLIQYIIKLVRFRFAGVAPLNDLDDTFKREGERIIKSLESLEGEEAEVVYGEFSLPKYLTLVDSDIALEEKKNLSSPTRKRSVLHIGKTKSELRKQLPQKLQILWEKLYNHNE
jgi:hypothetical protein